MAQVGHSLGITVYVRETGVRRKAGHWTQSWERTKGNSPSGQHFIAWDGVCWAKLDLLMPHIPQLTSPCTTGS